MSIFVSVFAGHTYNFVGFVKYSFVLVTVFALFLCHCNKSVFLFGLTDWNLAIW